MKLDTSYDILELLCRKLHFLGIETCFSFCYVFPNIVDFSTFFLKCEQQTSRCIISRSYRHILQFKIFQGTDPQSHINSFRLLHQAGNACSDDYLPITFSGLIPKLFSQYSFLYSFCKSDVYLWFSENSNSVFYTLCLNSAAWSCSSFTFLHFQLS